MLRRPETWVLLLTLVSLASASANFETRPLSSDLQFIPKSLNEFRQQDNLYSPPRVHMEIDAESSKTAQYLDVFKATSKTLSDLLLTKPLSEKIMLGENDQCSEVSLSQAIKIEGIAADLVLFVIPHKEKMHAQICGGSGQMIESVALYINIEKLNEFDKANQVKVLCKTVIRAIYEKGSIERKQMMKDIDDYQVELGANCPANCSSCSDPNSCDTCSSGYWLAGDSCLPCASPCQACYGSAISCTSCLPGYYLFGSDNSCEPCEEPCATCAISAYYCTGCDTGYFLDDNDCSACSPQCYACSGSATTCTGCPSGQFLNGNSCQNCISPCATCSSSTFCLSCDSSALVLNNGVCSCIDPNAELNPSADQCQCKSGYIEVNGVCTICFSPCATCTNTGACTSCLSGYYLSGASCLACSAQCTTCVTSANTCTSCPSGYYLNGSTCSQCSSGCAECTSATSCQTCYDPADTYNTGSGTCKCSDPNSSLDASNTCECNPGYIGTPGNCIANCTPQCATCSGFYNCLTCNDPSHTHLFNGACTCVDQNSSFNNSTLLCQCNQGYFGQPNSCQACSNGCLTCTSTSSCSACIQGMSLVNGACVCPANSNWSSSSNSCVCNAGFYLDNFTGQCYQCGGNCQTCSSQSVCTSCIDSVHAQPPACDCPSTSINTNGVCTCASGTVFNNNICCPSDCNTCDQSGNCTACNNPTMTIVNNVCLCSAHSSLVNNLCVCDTGYFMDTNNVCQPCPSGCATCSSDGVCLSCTDPHMVLSYPTCVCPAYSYMSGKSCACFDGFYFSTPTHCALCVEPCATCSDQYTCTSCQDPAHMKLVDGGCECIADDATFDQGACICNKGYYYDGHNECKSCSALLNVPTLLECVREKSCLCASKDSFYDEVTGTCQCNSGFYPSSQSECSACSISCLECSDANTCTACAEGMLLEDGACKTEEDDMRD
ncbi:unnamed protein product [Blepharisma stoltei]|uniref:EGF-like domain-containing protein n=1 Tax=Blepharisma stoltei TaxID=1481888 RepID=A0AAU9J4Q4_9CILI|nr:unnamed protein product [Blepharisma stoltei]